MTRLERQRTVVRNFRAARASVVSDTARAMDDRKGGKETIQQAREELENNVDQGKLRLATAKKRISGYLQVVGLEQLLETHIPVTPPTHSVHDPLYGAISAVTVAEASIPEVMYCTTKLLEYRDKIKRLRRILLALLMISTLAVAIWAFTVWH